MMRRTAECVVRSGWRVGGDGLDGAWPPTADTPIHALYPLLPLRPCSLGLSPRSLQNRAGGDIRERRARAAAHRRRQTPGASWRPGTRHTVAAPRRTGKVPAAWPAPPASQSSEFGTGRPRTRVRPARRQTAAPPHAETMGSVTEVRRSGQRQRCNSTRPALYLTPVVHALSCRDVRPAATCLPSEALESQRSPFARSFPLPLKHARTHARAMPTDRELQIAQALLDYIHRSPSPFHAVQNAVQRLEQAGFRELPESVPWHGRLRPGGQYYLVRNGTTLAAFCIGSDCAATRGEACAFHVVGAHTDSPCLRLKPRTATSAQGYLQTAVECYGGGLWYTWFDRDLTCAGRVMVRAADGRCEPRLVHVPRPVLRVPSLAIHLDRDVNAGFAPNKQTHLLPVLALHDVDTPDSSTKGGAKNRHHSALLQVLAEALPADGGADATPNGGRRPFRIPLRAAAGQFALQFLCSRGAPSQRPLGRRGRIGGAAGGAVRPRRVWQRQRARCRVTAAGESPATHSGLSRPECRRPGRPLSGVRVAIVGDQRRHGARGASQLRRPPRDRTPSATGRRPGAQSERQPAVRHRRGHGTSDTHRCRRLRAAGAPAGIRGAQRYALRQHHRPDHRRPHRHTHRRPRRTLALYALDPRDGPRGRRRPHRPPAAPLLHRINSLTSSLTTTPPYRRTHRQKEPKHRRTA
eukprot:ctg_1307.g424